MKGKDSLCVCVCCRERVELRGVVGEGGWGENCVGVVERGEGMLNGAWTDDVTTEREGASV
jgi:hypothetical protein